MQDLPKGPSAERSNGPVNSPGIYELKTNDGVKRLITSPGVEGSVQADALVRVGFKWTAPVPSREELLATQKAQAAKDAPAPKPVEVKA